MQLRLGIHPVSEIRFGASTRLDGEVLSVDVEALRRHLLEDPRTESVEFEIVAPGEACRIGSVYDIVEPRGKERTDGVDFPGVLGPPLTAGRRTTHVLRGAAVTVLEESGARIIEMRGEAAAYTPYSQLNHLVVIPGLQPALRRHRRLGREIAAKLKEDQVDAVILVSA